MISKTEIRRVLLWTISTSIAGTFLGLYLINTFFVPLDGSPIPLPTWIGFTLILPSMWLPHLGVQIHNHALGWIVLGTCQFIGYGIIVTLVRSAFHRWRRRNTQPAGGAYFLPGAGKKSAHP